jgi:hypothetical protein
VVAQHHHTLHRLFLHRQELIKRFEMENHRTAMGVLMQVVVVWKSKEHEFENK